MFQIIALRFALIVTFVSGDNLTRSETDERYPSWSPDGTKILFESFRNGNWDVFCLDLKDRKVTNLTEHSANDRSPAWDATGRRLIFQSDRDSVQDAYLMDFDTRRVRRLFLAEGSNELSPHLSNSGKYVVYTAQDSGHFFIRRMDLTTGESIDLTSRRGRSLWPRWSPSDSGMVFFTRRDEHSNDDEIYTLSFVTAALRRITDKNGHDFCPSWSPNGRWIAAASIGEPFDRGIAIYDLSGKMLKVIGTGFERVTQPVWSPDSRRIVYTARREGNFDLFVEDVDLK